jgi:peptidyl-prolyl cis-trans isomerase A (cyclophilin A)
MSRYGFLPVLLLMVSCGENSDVAAERDRLQTRVVEAEKMRKRLEREADGLHMRVRKLGDEVQTLRKRLAFTKLEIEEGDPLRAVLHTSRGLIHCDLWPDKSPLTVLNFVQLAEGTRTWTDPRTGKEVQEPLYDDIFIHRVKPRFMIQMGDPLGTGAGGPGYTFSDETENGLSFDEAGLLAMANVGPNTNGSQFFITDRSTPSDLDGKHTIFGKCGDEAVVQTIAETPRDARDRPEVDVTLVSVTIVRGS